MDKPRDTELVGSSRMGSRVQVMVYPGEKKKKTTTHFHGIFPGRRRKVVAEAHGTELVGLWGLQPGG